MKKTLALCVFLWPCTLAAQETAVVVNGASFRPDAPVASGALVSAFGRFGDVSGDASALPLPKDLGGVQVLVNSAAAPLLAVRPGQVNFQVPRTTAAGQVSIRVTRGGTTVASGTMQVAAVAPGLFVIPGSLSQPGAVLNQDFRLNTESVPARAGEVIQIFATGQGATEPAVEDGGPAPSQPLARSTAAPRVFLGSEATELLFTGLTPGFSGLWQINARVPSVQGLSGQVPLFVAIGGRVSNPITVWVQQ